MFDIIAIGNDRQSTTFVKRRLSWRDALKEIAFLTANLGAFMYSWNRGHSNNRITFVVGYEIVESCRF